MMKGNGFDRKLRRGTLSFGIAVAVIAVVILLNALMSVLCFDNRWYIETTGEQARPAIKGREDGRIYRLTDAAIHLLGSTLDSVNEKRDEDDPVVVDIIFCADPDLLYGNSQMRYIYYTALEMQNEFPESIRVSTRDVWDNPSSVDAYRTNSYSTIYQTDVIVASGTDFRIYSAKSFYVYNTNSQTDPWGYCGEKKFLSGIIAVTRAEAPVCALTVNHGEPFATEEGRAKYSELLKVIDQAGYNVVYLDLEKEEIPKDCRLIITFDPQEDFESAFYGGTVSEASKMEKFLDQAYSYMVFFDADTPKLPILEEYLEEWGIVVDRHSSADAAGNETTGAYQIVDLENALNMDGTSVIGQYLSDGLGGSLTSDMRKTGASPKVVFGNAVSFSYSPTYQFTYMLADEEAGTGAYTYGYYFRNNWARDIFDVFTTGSSAYAYAKNGGNRLTDANGEDLVVDTYNPQDPYRLMTLTRHTRTVGEGQGYTSINDASYVCAVGSTEFASNEVLSSNAYGNTDALLATLRTIGSEVVPVGLTWVSLYESEIGKSYADTLNTTLTTVVLAFLPAVAFTFAGLFVLVRRRVRN